MMFMSEGTDKPLWAYIYVWDASQLPAHMYHIMIQYERVLLCGESGALYLPSHLYKLPDLPDFHCIECFTEYMIRCFNA
jgi:hypothetical protein